LLKRDGQLTPQERHKECKAFPVAPRAASSST
jgi:hypothetical protein